MWQNNGKKALEEKEDGGVLFTHDIDEETPKINIVMNKDDNKQIEDTDVNWDDI